MSAEAKSDMRGARVLMLPNAGPAGGFSIEEIHGLKSALWIELFGASRILFWKSADSAFISDCTDAELEPPTGSMAVLEIVIDGFGGFPQFRFSDGVTTGQVMAMSCYVETQATIQLQAVIIGQQMQKVVEAVASMFAQASTRQEGIAVPHLHIPKGRIVQ